MPIPDRIGSFPAPPMRAGLLRGINPPFGGLSPCPGQVAYALRTRAPVAGGHIAAAPLPLDLHVLGLSLAFILSQDQTLRCMTFLFACFFQGTDARPALAGGGSLPGATSTCQCAFFAWTPLRRVANRGAKLGGSFELSKSFFMSFDRYPPTFQKAGAKAESDNLRVLLLNHCTDGGGRQQRDLNALTFSLRRRTATPRTDAQERKSPTASGPWGFHIATCSLATI